VTVEQRAEEERLEFLAARVCALRADLEAINGLIERAHKRFADLEMSLIRKPVQSERLIDRLLGKVAER
jgi:hypothetical protein